MNAPHKLPQDEPETPRGALFILVGPGGVGKNTLMEVMLAERDNLRQLATATTRPARPGEVEGVHHLFVSLDAFNALRESDQLVEHEEVHPGVFYGVPRAPIQTAIEEGRFLIADIECAGAEKVRQAYPADTVVIFVMPTSLDVLEERMRERGESPEGIAKRMARAERELLYKDQCDYVIINDDFETAAQALREIITREQARRRPAPAPARTEHQQA